jgi:glycosyltransferase involved in cell wall biosynthesis
MREMEIRLIKKADTVFVTADHLYRDKVQFNKNTFLVEHGVDHEHFSQVLKGELSIPSDMQGIKGPILGFFGLIHEWIDLDLIEYVARAMPEWSIVMIGKCSIDISRFKPYNNVVFLGQKPYESLPAYCRAFDVGLIPFVVNELTINVNPIKLREYLSSGLPVVSTSLPEVEKYHDIVQMAATYEEFVAKVEHILTVDSPGMHDQRSLRMASETWLGKVEYISQCVGAGATTAH